MCVREFRVKFDVSLRSDLEEYRRQASVVGTLGFVSS